MGNAKSTMFYLWKDKPICHCMSLLWFVSFHGLQLKLPVTKHCFTIPKETADHNLGADHKCCQGAQLASLLHTDIGQDRVRVVRRRPTNDDVPPWNGKSCNLNLMMLEHQDIIVFQVKVWNHKHQTSLIIYWKTNHKSKPRVFDLRRPD